MRAQYASGPQPCLQTPRLSCTQTLNHAASPAITTAGVDAPAPPRRTLAHASQPERRAARQP